MELDLLAGNAMMVSHIVCLLVSVSYFLLESWVSDPVVFQPQLVTVRVKAMRDKLGNVIVRREREREREREAELWEEANRVLEMSVSVVVGVCR